ncbi:L,D-transpeptidase family protein [Sporichthya polymorpha]|uniref:L,D-transpeptidase family protein n=1 Tax=Sporichthya polymorpha TaxID=35751 RepID=UPI000376BFAE|nr:L,D-transpeptidase family protein [Sporichthya polymorpha]
MDGRPPTRHAAPRRRRFGARAGRFLLTGGAAIVCALGVTGALDPSTHVSEATAITPTTFGVQPGPLKAAVAKGARDAAAATPAWAQGLPQDTTQVLRTVRTDRWCKQIWCARTEAWERVDGVWRIATRGSGENARPMVVRSQIGQNGFASPGVRRQGDMRTPSGVYGVVTTFSTTKHSPTAMPWRRRLPTSVVSDARGRTYNTWIEVKGARGGDRRMMSWGLWMDWNNPRLAVGQGLAPVPGRGSGIFMHTSNAGAPWVPTAGCVQLGNPADMEWVVRWLRPEANPRIVNNR